MNTDHNNNLFEKFIEYLYKPVTAETLAVYCTLRELQAEYTLNLEQLELKTKMGINTMKIEIEKTGVKSTEAKTKAENHYKDDLEEITHLNYKVNLIKGYKRVYEYKIEEHNNKIGAAND